jgi:hypothetical protein
VRGNRSPRVRTAPTPRPITVPLRVGIQATWASADKVWLLTPASTPNPTGRGGWYQSDASPP